MKYQNILGNNYTLSEVQTAPLSFLKRVTEHNNDVAFYTVDGRPVLLLNHPELIKVILSARNKHYVKTNTPEMFMLRPILGNGMLTSDGEEWKIQRNVAQSGFTKDNVLNFFDIMTQETSLMLEKWKDKKNIDLESELSELTLKIVGASLFGASLDNVAAKFGESVRIINGYMGHYDYFNFKGRIEFEEALYYIKNLVFNIITEGNNDNGNNKNLLSLLLENITPHQDFNNNDIVDQIFTFLMAGHETTAKALTWTLYELIKNKEKLNQLEQEIESILGVRSPNLTNVHKLEYTWMVIREGIRLHPPVWIMSRTASIDDEIQGIKILKGTTVLISPYLIHRHKKYWSEPELYQPHRFAFQEEKVRDPNVFIPFSAGPRKCIGMNFANIEMVVVLAMIIQKFEFKLKEGFIVEEEALVTLRPKYGMEVLINKK